MSTPPPPTPSSSSSFPDLTSVSNVKRTPLEIRTNQNNFIDQCSYNCELILQMAQNRDALGNITPAVKASIVSIIAKTSALINDFAIVANLSNMSPEKQLGFYFPVYKKLNLVEYIQLGIDINLKDFLEINENTGDTDIILFTSTALSQLKNY